MLVETLPKTSGAEPVFLNPEAREDANKVMVQVWRKGMELLGGRRQFEVKEAQASWRFLSKDCLKEGPFQEKGIDLIIIRTSRGLDQGGKGPYDLKEVFNFYPYYVLKHSQTNWDYPRRVETKTEESDRDPLEELLGDVEKFVALCTVRTTC